MPYNPEIHHRRSIRLPGYDYAQPGAYFVTICTAQRDCIFGQIVDDAVVLTQLGLVAGEEWFHSSEIRPEVALYEDEFVVMPNHIHGIVHITSSAVGATGGSPLPPPPFTVGATGRSPLPSPGPQPYSLGAMIAGYKSAVTKRINRIRNMPGAAVWLRNYWEHVIRDEADLERIVRYVRENPARWADDQLYPSF